MKRISRRIGKMLIVSLLVIALLVPMTVPVFGDDLIDDLIRQNNELILENLRLQEQIREMQQGSGPSVQEPRLHVISPQVILIEPGETRDFEVVVRNIGNHTANNILSTASVNTGAPFFVEFLNNTNRFNVLADGRQRTMTMRITVDENAEPGTVGSITLLHRYSNDNGVPDETSDIISVRIGGEVEEEGTPTIRLQNLQNSVQNLGPDQSFTVSATIVNQGSAPAENVQITLADLDTDFIVLTSDLNQASFPVLEPGESRQISVTFRTVRGIGSGFHIINFRVLYDGVAATRPSTPFHVTVVGDYATTSPNIELRGMTVPTGRLNVGQTGRIQFELVNAGDAVAQNILVTATPMVQGNLVPTTLNRQSVQSLGIGETRAFEFGFMPTVAAGTHNHPVQIRVEYEIPGASGEPIPFVQYVGLNVYNPEPVEDEDDPDPGRTQTPRVIVSAFAPYPQIPRAGQNFELEVTFLNTSTTRSVNNVMIVLEAQAAALPGGQMGSAVFTPVGGSNTLFVPSLAPGEAYTQTLTMFTLPDAAPRMYSLQVNLVYQDQDYNDHEATQMLSIPVAQLARIETEPPEIFVMPFMDMFGFVDFEFRVLNTGRVDLRNLRVRVEGNFDVGEAGGYMGPLNVQRTNTFRGRIRPLEPGFHEGEIIIYAEDEAGEIVYISHPFSIDVMGFDDFGDDFDMGMEGGRPGMGMDDEWFEGGGDRFPGMMPNGEFGYDPFGEEEGGIFSRLWAFVRTPIFWGPAAGVIVAIIIGVVVMLNRKRSQLDFDD